MNQFSVEVPEVLKHGFLFFRCKILHRWHEEFLVFFCYVFWVEFSQVVEVLPNIVYRLRVSVYNAYICVFKVTVATATVYGQGGGKCGPSVARKGNEATANWEADTRSSARDGSPASHSHDCRSAW